MNGRSNVEGDHDAAWPRLPLDEWRATHDTLHMWLQMVGKTRLALAPKQNHWWHVVFYLTSRGLTTKPMPFGAGTFDLDFDFIEHRLVVQTSDGATRHLPLRPMAVADFYREYLDALRGLGIEVRLWPVPSEADHTIPFTEDRTHASYEAAQVRRFHGMLLRADRILKRFAGRFLGKSSPVHFFWGAFDLALTRFSGRRAPERKEDWWVIREANSHEEISVGFWPGSGSVPEPAFYAYARPEPAGLAATSIAPAAASYDRALANFILRWDDLRGEPSPDAAVLEFCQSAYEAAARLGGWDPALDRPRSEWP
jgi:hypothetical protein